MTHNRNKRVTIWTLVITSVALFMVSLDNLVVTNALTSIREDLGASLGETGRMDPRRGYVNGFEREPFIVGVENGRVRFGFRGRHQELIANITAEDVRWTCNRLQRITDPQWIDAFRAGNFSADLTRRYMTRIQQKITQGLELK